MPEFAFSEVDVVAGYASPGGAPLPFSGNPLAVVHDADALDEQQMQSFARWTNLSETAFLLRPSTTRAGGGADYRVRIFTPGGELPFAGHPTLGSCHAWLEARGLGGPVHAAPREVVQQCGVGLVRIRRAADGAEGAAFEAPPVTITPVDAPLLDAVLRALDVAPAHVREARWLDNGPRWLGLLLDDAERVLAVEPDHAALKTLAKVGVVGPHPPGAPVQFEVRAFASMVGIPEDPVTGSLNAALAQWLIPGGHAPSRYVAAQGARLGRAGRVRIEREPDGTVWVGGRSVTRVRGTLVL